jgi:hypothetical protein
MYSSDLINKLLEQASEYVLKNDRYLYKPFFEASEKLIAEKSVIGGATGIDLLLSAPITKNSFEWELYAESPYVFGKQLADILVNVNAPFVFTEDTRPVEVKLTTKLRNKELELQIGNRLLFRIYAIGMYRGVSLMDVMKPSVTPGYYGNMVQCVPEEIQLITIYRKLYSPLFCKEWPDLVQKEQQLYELVKSERKIGGYTVSGESDYTADDLDDTTYTTDSTDSTNYIGGVDQLLDLESVVVCGDYAFSTLFGNELPKFARLQVISDDVKRTIADITAQVPTATYVKYELHLPNDFQIVKYIVYKDATKTRSIVDIFNCAEFEIIPFVVSNNTRIANLWVLLRIMFIDIWTIRLLINAGSGTSFSTERIKTLIKLTEKIRNVQSVENAETVENTEFKDVFPKSNYYGVYVNESVVKTQMLKELGERLQPYIPKKIEL